MVFQLRKYWDSIFFSLSLFPHAHVIFAPFTLFKSFFYVGYHWYDPCAFPPAWDRVTSFPVTRQEGITTNINFDLGRTIVSILESLIKKKVVWQQLWVASTL